eukprot:jgi/Chlat1/6862/Chrsp51S06540
MATALATMECRPIATVAAVLAEPSCRAKHGLRLQRGVQQRGVAAFRLPRTSKRRAGLCVRAGANEEYDKLKSHADAHGQRVWEENKSPEGASFEISVDEEYEKLKHHAENAGKAAWSEGNAYKADPGNIQFEGLKRKAAYNIADNLENQAKAQAQAAQSQAENAGKTVKKTAKQGANQVRQKAQEADDVLFGQPTAVGEAQEVDAVGLRFKWPHIIFNHVLPSLVFFFAPATLFRKDVRVTLLTLLDFSFILYGIVEPILHLVSNKLHAVHKYTAPLHIAAASFLSVGFFKDLVNGPKDWLLLAAVVFYAVLLPLRIKETRIAYGEHPTKVPMYGI